MVNKKGPQVLKESQLILTLRHMLKQVTSIKQPQISEWDFGDFNSQEALALTKVRIWKYSVFHRFRPGQRDYKQILLSKIDETECMLKTMTNQFQNAITPNFRETRSRKYLASARDSRILPRLNRSQTASGILGSLDPNPIGFRKIWWKSLLKNSIQKSQIIRNNYSSL